MNFHKLLNKQINKHLPEALQNHPGIESLLNAINDSYVAFERDKELADRAFRISEEEYVDINAQLKHEIEVKHKSVEKLKETLGLITGQKATNDTDDVLMIANYINQQVSQRKNAELVFTSLVNNLQNAILLEDETRHIVYANQEFCDLFNIPALPQELQGIDCSNSAEQSKGLFKEPDNFVSVIDRLLLKKELVTGEIIQMANGRILERNYIPIYQDKKYKGHLWNYTDITEKKKAQDAIEKSELTNRLILNASLDAIVIINEGSEINFWNPQAEKIFGWKEKEIKGKKLSNTIIPEKFRKRHESGMQDYHETGNGPVLNKIIEITAVNQKGQEFPIELSIIPVKQETGTFFCGFIRDISERKKAEMELKASKERWQFALEGAGDGVWEYNFETKEVFFSKQYKKMLGYEDDEFKNDSSEWFGRIHRDDIEIITATDKDYFDKKIISHQREYRIKHKKGEYRWILDRGTLIKHTESGEPQIIIGTHTDITERKKAEEEYKRISVVASANENGVVFTDAEGKISWSNEGFLKLTGYTKDEVTGKTPLEICEGPLSKSKAMEDMVSAFFEGRSFNVEIIHYRKDKTWFWGRVTGQAIMDGDKKVKQYFAIIENITYKKEAEQAIKINEEKYRNIIANMNLGLLEVDNEENIQFANHSFCGMSGYTLEELIGKKASTLFVREESSELMETKNDMRKKGVSDAYEIYIKNKSGEDKWWLISGAARYNDKRELVGSIGIHLDITQQKNLELELIEAREQAELSANAKQTFLANMSHEVRTPMNAILGMGRQLQKTALNEQQQLYLQTINDAGENLLVVINDILDISKIEAGKLTLENIGFNINDVIKRAIQVMQYRAEEKGLKIISSADENIGPILQGDPYRLNQILLNLLSNTVKFSDKGIIQISCQLISNESNHQLIEIKVTDNGIGMEKKFLDNLFQSFTQEDRSVSRKYGGTGLGMAITKQLVELMGGSIDVQSKKDIGTTVTITIPFIKGTINMLPDQDIKNLDKNILKDKEILLVEDNEMNRLVATTTLNYYGAVITEAINGAEAVELLKKFEYDLILMDMQMPVMDGLEATRVIRNELQSTVPIIALTANAIKGENEKCITAGMNDYISKPFDEQNLVNMIAKWLGEKDNIIAKQEITTTNKLYDLSNLKAISRGDDNFIKKMIMLFIEQVPPSLLEIHSAFEQNNFAKIYAVAHRIKPSIDNMGISSLKNVIRQIESLAQKNQHSNELNLKIEKLDNVLKETIKALENEF